MLQHQIGQHSEPAHHRPVSPDRHFPYVPKVQQQGHQQPDNNPKQLQHNLAVQPQPHPPEGNRQEPNNVEDHRQHPRIHPQPNPRTNPFHLLKHPAQRPLTLLFSLQRRRDRLPHHHRDFREYHDRCRRRHGHEVRRYWG